MVCILEEESPLARICEYSDVNLLKYSIILTSGKFWEQLEIQHDRSLLKGVYGVYRDTYRVGTGMSDIIGLYSSHTGKEGIKSRTTYYHTQT